jgi:ASCH domain
VLRALVFEHPWIDLILDGKKCWEVRGSPTSVRGMIGLVPSGSETVVGVCDVVDCLGPLSVEEFCLNAWKAGVRPSAAQLARYAWVFDKPRYLNRPVSYRPLPGAVIWVRLDDCAERKILNQLKSAR